MKYRLPVLLMSLMEAQVICAIVFFVGVTRVALIDVPLLAPEPVEQAGSRLATS